MVAWQVVQQAQQQDAEGRSSRLAGQPWPQLARQEGAQSQRQVGEPPPLARQATLEDTLGQAPAVARSDPKDAPLVAPPLPDDAFLRELGEIAARVRSIEDRELCAKFGFVARRQAEGGAPEPSPEAACKRLRRLAMRYPRSGTVLARLEAAGVAWVGRPLRARPRADGPRPWRKWRRLVAWDAGSAQAPPRRSPPSCLAPAASRKCPRSTAAAATTRR